MFLLGGGSYTCIIISRLIELLHEPRAGRAKDYCAAQGIFRAAPECRCEAAKLDGLVLS
jgi:hypothetical protein